MTTLVTLVALLAPLLGTGAAVLVARRDAGGTLIGRACVASTAVATLASLVLVALVAVADDGVPPGLVALPDWFAVQLDRAAALLLAAVTLIGLVVASFSTRSLDAAHQRAPGYYVAIAAVVTGGALVVVPGGPVPLVVGWLLSGWALVGLTGGWADSSSARRAHSRLRSSVIIGDAALIGAVAFATAAAGPEAVTDASAAVAELEGTTVLGVGVHTLVALLVVVAGAARSALFPFHRWLTATLYAPTPVSALVHAGFVSGAGLLLIRFAPTFTAVDAAVALAVVLATVTIVVGSVASLTRPDAKGALAWSTVAQMAFMVIQCAIGAFAAAVFHIVGHGMYKAAQFLGVGDTVVAGLRSRRRPVRATPLVGRSRAVATVAITTVAVAIGVLVGPSGLDGDERIVLVAFAWCSLAAAVHGMLGTPSLTRAGAVATAGVGALAAGIGYFIGIDLTKRFLETSFASVDVDADLAAVAVVAVVATLAALSVVPGRIGAAWREQLRWWVDGATVVRAPLDLATLGPVSTATDTATGDGPATDEVGAAELRAQVARAAEIIAPTWPLASFVAVNPLSGLETHTFDDATAEARRWTRGRTHRTLQQFRCDHAQGRTTSDDLAYAVHDAAIVACAQPAVVAPGRSVEAAEVVLTDLLSGPEVDAVAEPRTALERRLGVGAPDRLVIDELVGEWVAAHVARPTWAFEHHTSGFVAVARRQAIRHARRRLGADAVAWLEGLDDDPARVLARSLAACGVRPTDRIDEIRGHLVSLAGWAGFARWRTEWAHPNEATPSLRPIDIAAARAMLEAAVLVSLGGTVGRHGGSNTDTELAEIDTDALPARVEAVVDHLGLPDDENTRAAVAEILSLVPASLRVAIWLRAQERNFEQRMLGELDGVEPAARSARPDAQVVFCIDVRSEGLRRHLESEGRDETIGFAGFFGVPMSVRELGWSQPEARCPVLVAPAASAIEQPLVDHVGDAARELTRSGLRGAVATAHAETKHVPGAAFATAETLGWFTGVAAAWRTLAPSHARHAGLPSSTTVRIGDDVGIEQRVFTAEAVLRTMGLTRGFADLVVLCGHTSGTVNNAHATALECGACAGASGASNARAVAALLNESDVRTGLAARGIEIPDATWFVGAVHDTASDLVTVLDRHVAPATRLAAIDELQLRLDRAGASQAADRALHLPGATSSDVRRRGRDWAQVRPEWGLATNAAFVIAPRSVTVDLDLDGRAFLHSYDAADDPDGSVLEAIMTAPLVVGHWISAQYYFSTVDPERFGAGDKLVHNPIGTVGVVTGPGGDLRVGLPAQSTHVAGSAHHQPLRLLAVVQADITTVESIIARNEVLARLVNGSWLRIAARSQPGEPWSTRSPGGTWSQMLRSDDLDGIMERTLQTEAR